MKFEARPQFVDAMQWDGDPETLIVLLNWIMANRVGDANESSPTIYYSRRWGPHAEMQGQPRAQLEGFRWSVDVETGDWIIKDGARIRSMSDEIFKNHYKQSRGKR